MEEYVSIDQLIARLLALRQPGGPQAAFGLGGVFKVQCFDRDGNLRWEDTAKNAVTDQGLNHALDVVFHGTTPVSPWYIGLITGTGTLVAADTLASHAGWTEGTDYTGTRKEWTEGAASGKAMTNATVVDFVITGTMTVQGAFLCGDDEGTEAVLFCTALFDDGEQAVRSGDMLRVTYTIYASTT